MATDRYYSAPPRTEFEGREYEVRLTFRCPTDLTEDQLSEWLVNKLQRAKAALAKVRGEAA